MNLQSLSSVYHSMNYVDQNLTSCALSVFLPPSRSVPKKEKTIR